MRRSLPADLVPGPFTTAEARRAGLPEKVLYGPLVQRVFPGAYVAAGTEVTDAVAVAAARKLVPGETAAIGVTALRLHGVDVGPARPVRLAGTHPWPVERSSVAVLRTAELPPHTDGLVTPGYAFVSAARHLSLVELVVAGDWLVRLGLGSPRSLGAEAGRYRGWGAVGARRAAAHVRGRVDSPQESRLRLCLVLAGLPEPLCNNPIMWHDVALGRPDLMYERFRVCLEYEGDHHRSDRRQWNTDIARHDDFRGEGWHVLRVTAQTMRDPRRLVRRTYEALRDRGYGGPEPRFGAEWSALFERRGR